MILILYTMKVLMMIPHFRDLEPQIVTTFKERYTLSLFAKDTFAGLTVAIVALPLAMAIAIASNLPPERGLFTAIVAGFLISAHGGSRFQIGGPTAAFIVTVATVSMKHGYDGLVLATLLAGLLLILMSLVRAGEVIKFIPYPVIVGFTSGIALLIAFSQLRDFFGLSVGTIPPDFIAKLILYLDHLHETNPLSVMIALCSIAIILLCQKVIPKIPGPIVVILVTALCVTLWKLPVETIESRFGAIPAMLPPPIWPEITFEKIRILFPDAITIAVLAAIESLLSAVVADGMTGVKHKPNAELLGQGLANIASPLFGGLPATGAIARTATNIKGGAQTPMAGVMHAVWLFLFMILFAPLIIKIPLAALAAILMVVAWNMSEIKHIRQILKAPRGDRVVMFVTFVLTIFVDLNFAIQAGISLAAILFINNMMHATRIDPIDRQNDPDATNKKTIPPHVEVYEINGPLFFGVAEKLVDTITILEKPPKVFILRMRYVPLIDAAGVHALETLFERLLAQKTQLILSGVTPEVQHYLHKAGFDRRLGKTHIVDHIDKALLLAQQLSHE